VPVGIGPASGAAAASGVALTAYRSALADQLGLYDGTLVVTALGSGPDGRRYLILDGLRDDEAARDAWAGGYAYAHTAPVGTQFKLLGQGYHGQFGAVAVANPPASAVPIGTAVELSSPLPIKRRGAILGIDDLINIALRRCPVRARLHFTGDATREHSLLGYPFVESEDDILGLYDTLSYGIAGAPLEPSDWGFRLTADGASKTLVTDATYASGAAFDAEVLVKGDRLVNDGTGWLYPTTPGLLDDAYQAAVPLAWVVAFGMVEGIKELMKLVRMDRSLDRAERAVRLTELAAEAVHWGRSANRIAVAEFPKLTTRRTVGRFPLPSLTTWTG
jgi:hypothetical protein